MIETFRMLGNERQADFEREAQQSRRAALVPKCRRRRDRAAAPRRLALLGGAVWLTGRRAAMVVAHLRRTT